MSNDFGEFCEASFDVKAWINRACAQATPEDEPLEKFLAELEMRLQLTAEEIESSLHDLSVQAMRRIPFAVQEIYRLQGDIQGMQDQMHGLAGSIKRDAATAMESVSDLKQLDKVKNNMESACSTLKEATELSGLFVKVEEVFLAGDLPTVADILSRMRRSLSLVGDVPEFRAGRQKLHQLEDRLQGMIEGSLAEALSRSGDEEAVQKLCALLLAVDRLPTVTSLYCSTRSAIVMVKWDDMAAAPPPPAAAAAAAAAHIPALAWLPRFLSWLASFLEAEVEWCGRVLPQQQQQLVAGLALSLFRKVSRGIKDALASGAAAAQLRGPGAIALLVGLQRDLTVLATSVAHLLKGADAQVRKDILTLVFLPVEDKVAAYASMEQAQLSADLAAGAQLSRAPASSADEVVAQMSGSSKAAFAVLHLALDRCLGFTGGTELRALMRTVDHELAALLTALQTQVTALHDKQTGGAAASSKRPSPSSAAASQQGTDHSGTPGGGGGGGARAVAGTLGYGDDSEEVAGTLRLLLVYADLSSSLNKLETDLRTTIATVVPKLEAAAERGKAAPPDAVALRLDSSPDKLAKAQQLRSSLQDPRFVALPGATAALDALHSCIQSTLLDALLAKVKVQLTPLASMPEWRRSTVSGSSAVVLPSFNSYPLPYVTAIGEYLMTMPQQLEVLMSEDDAMRAAGAEADVEELAAEWLDRVVTGAAALYAEQVSLISELSLQGGAQLAADVEYFCNVMSALHGAPPPSLLTVQLFAGQAAEQFTEAARAAAADGGADMAMLRTLAAMRHLPLA